MMRIIISLFIVPCISYAAGPVYSHKDETTQREFTELYSISAEKKTSPKIYQTAGAPTFAPLKIGDMAVSTTTGKVYIATATATSGSWAIMN